MNWRWLRRRRRCFFVSIHIDFNGGDDW